MNNELLKTKYEGKVKNIEQFVTDLSLQWWLIWSISASMYAMQQMREETVANKVENKAADQAGYRRRAIDQAEEGDYSDTCRGFQANLWHTRQNE